MERRMNPAPPEDVAAAIGMLERGKDVLSSAHPIGTVDCTHRGIGTGVSQFDQQLGCKLAGAAGSSLKDLPLPPNH